MLKTIYQEIAKKLETIDFSQLWQGFYRFDFALYNQNEVILNNRIFDKTDEFIANTAILYHDQWIAIWMLEENEADLDLDILTSKIVHEMFHAYQMQRQEKRFANEIEAIFRYTIKPTLFQLKSKENNLLANLLEDINESEFNQVLSLRKERYRRYPYQTGYESKVEAIEGSAQYVELLVLKQLNIDKYQSSIDKLKQRLTDIQRLLPVRVNCYDSGAAMFLVCQELNKVVDFAIKDCQKGFFDDLIENADESSIDLQVNSIILDYLKNDQQSLLEKVNDYLGNGQLIREGNYHIKGLNIYDARKINNYVFSNYFLQIEDQNLETLMGNFMIEVSDSKAIKVYQLN